MKARKQKATSSADNQVTFDNDRKRIVFVFTSYETYLEAGNQFLFQESKIVELRPSRVPGIFLTQGVQRWNTLPEIKEQLELAGFDPNPEHDLVVAKKQTFFMDHWKYLVQLYENMQGPSRLLQYYLVGTGNTVMRHQTTHDLIRNKCGPDSIVNLRYADSVVFVPTSGAGESTAKTVMSFRVERGPESVGLITPCGLSVFRADSDVNDDCWFLPRGSPIPLELMIIEDCKDHHTVVPSAEMPFDTFVNSLKQFADLFVRRRQTNPGVLRQGVQIKGTLNRLMARELLAQQKMVMVSLVARQQ